MKAIFLAIGLFMAANCGAQKLDIITIDSLNYVVERDTADTGVILIKYVPVQSFVFELTDRLFQARAKTAATEANINRLQERRKALVKDEKRIEKLIIDSGGIVPAKRKDNPPGN